MGDSAAVRGDERHRLDATLAVMGVRDAQKHGKGWLGHFLKQATGYGQILGMKGEKGGRSKWW